MLFSPVFFCWDRETQISDQALSHLNTLSEILSSSFHFFIIVLFIPPKTSTFLFLESMVYSRGDEALLAYKEGRRNSSGDRGDKGDKELLAPREGKRKKSQNCDLTEFTIIRRKKKGNPILTFLWDLVNGHLIHVCLLFAHFNPNPNSNPNPNPNLYPYLIRTYKWPSCKWCAVV